MIKKKMHKKDFKRLTKKTKQEKKTLKNSTKPSRSVRCEARPVIYNRAII